LNFNFFKNKFLHFFKVNFDTQKLTANSFKMKSISRCLCFRLLSNGYSSGNLRFAIFEYPAQMKTTNQPVAGRYDRS